MELADVGEVLGSLTLEERAVLEVAIKQLARDVTRFANNSVPY